MPRGAEAQIVVPSFNSVAALRDGLDAKARFEAVDLYPRDGSTLLGEVEKHVAGLVGVSEDEVLVYNSGMSAVTDAIDVGLHIADTDSPTLVCSEETYTQTKRYIEHFLRDRRARVAYFDSGNPADVERIIAKWQPDVVVAETVSNYVNVPVLDTPHLLKAARNSEKLPTLVIDNTLPLSTGLALGEVLDENDRVIVAESGTKSYTFNTSLFGVGYTKNQKLFDWMRRYRRTRGTLPGPEHLDVVSQLLPEDREAFDERNKRLFANTGLIAVSLASQVQEEVGLVVAHPEIPTHTNHDFYRESFPAGGAPVLYISSVRHDQYKIAEALWDNPDVRDQAQLGQSFGFDHTRIVADENIRAVRIAGGADTEAEAFGSACAQALSAI